MKTLNAFKLLVLFTVLLVIIIMWIVTMQESTNKLQVVILVTFTILWLLALSVNIADQRKALNK